MDLKEKLVKQIISKLNNNQKKEMVDAFYDKHNNNPKVDELLRELKQKLKYKNE